MRVITHPLPDVLQQADVWVHGQRLEDMDRHHRANLIPFLRGNARTLQRAAAAAAYLRAGAPITSRRKARRAGREAIADIAAQPAEDWLEHTPLMRRLVELEAGRPIEERRETFERNQRHEAETGYQKVRLG